LFFVVVVVVVVVVVDRIRPNPMPLLDSNRHTLSHRCHILHHHIATHSQGTHGSNSSWMQIRPPSMRSCLALVQLPMQRPMRAAMGGGGAAAAAAAAAATAVPPLPLLLLLPPLG
jgi:hypothetical protein